MLYITTVNDKDAYTAHKTLITDRGPNEELFVPFHLPVLEISFLEGLKTKSSGQIIADILNMFFSCGLSGWDVDFCVGKNPIKVQTMNHKLLIAEMWHNHEAKYDYIGKALFSKIFPNQSSADKPTEWFRIAIHIAVLFAVFGELLKQGVTELSKPIDIAVLEGDFTAPISAWYARKMGLPIGTIVCCCEDNSSVWDLVQRGEINTGNCSHPEGLERLLQSAFGCSEVREFKKICDNGSVYSLNEDKSNLINGTMFAAVISKDRIPAVINSMYRTNEYFIDENTAFAYAGLQDFRTRVSTGYNGLLLAMNSPDLSLEQISKATGVSKEQLMKR